MSKEQNPQKALRIAYSNIHRTKDIKSLEDAINLFVGDSTGKEKSKREKYVARLLKSSNTQRTYVTKLSRSETPGRSIDNLTVKELKALAEKLGLEVPARVLKQDLIDLINRK